MTVNRSRWQLHDDNDNDVVGHLEDELTAQLTESPAPEGCDMDDWQSRICATLRISLYV